MQVTRPRQAVVFGSTRLELRRLMKERTRMTALLKTPADLRFTTNDLALLPEDGKVRELTEALKKP